VSQSQSQNQNHSGVTTSILCPSQCLGHGHGQSSSKSTPVNLSMSMPIPLSAPGPSDDWHWVEMDMPTFPPQSDDGDPLTSSSSVGEIRPSGQTERSNVIQVTAFPMAMSQPQPQSQSSTWTTMTMPSEADMKTAAIEQGQNPGLSDPADLQRPVPSSTLTKKIEEPFSEEWAQKLRWGPRERWKFRCGTCAATFPRQHHLNDHFMTTHGEGLRLTCPDRYCQLQFPDLDTLRPHVLLVHGREGPASFCTFPGCGKTFLTPYWLSSHGQIHRGVKEFLCPQCGKLIN
jgi:hypothetical protein